MDSPTTGPFSPARLGPLHLRNRLIKCATFEGMTPDALVTDELIEFHREVAAGGVAMSTVAYCAISPEGRTDRHQIWMRPEAVPGLRRLTDAIHAEGALAAAQGGDRRGLASTETERQRDLFAAAAALERQPVVGQALDPALAPLDDREAAARR